MRRRAALAALGLLSWAARARADEAMAAEISARTGVARSAYASPEQHQVQGRATTLLLEARIAATPWLRARLRAPLARVGVEQPAGALRPQTAWGRPELGASAALPPTGPVRLRAGLAVGLPLGGGDAGQGQHPRVDPALALALAQGGFRDPELFAPGRLPLTPSLSAEAEQGRLRLSGEVKLPLLWLLDRGAPDPRVRVADLGAWLVVGAGAEVRLGRFDLGLQAWTSAALLQGAEERGRPQPRLHPALLPEAGLRLASSHLRLGLGALLALDGSGYGVVLRVSAQN